MRTHDDPLGQLPREVRPPRSLRDRVIGDLRRSGLIGRAAPSRAHVALAAAAALVLFAAGVWVGRSTAPAGSAPAPGARFALLLYQGPTYVRSDDEAERVAEYATWARSLGARLAMGEKLGEEERVLGPRPDTGDASGELLAGFFLIDASGWDEAMAIAGACPHLQYGGRVAVREIAT